MGGKMIITGKMIIGGFVFIFLLAIVAGLVIFKNGE